MSEDTNTYDPSVILAKTAEDRHEDIKRVCANLADLDRPMIGEWLSVILNACEKKHPLIPQLLAAGLPRALVRCLALDDLVLKVYVCRAFTGVLQDPATGQMFVTAGAVPALCEALKEENSWLLTRKDVAMIVCHIAMTGAGSRDGEFRKSGIIDLLMALARVELKDFEDELKATELERYKTVKTKNIEDGPKQAKVIRNGIDMKWILAYAPRLVESTRESAVTALSAIVSSSCDLPEENLAYAQNHELLDFLFETMQRPIDQHYPDSSILFDLARTVTAITSTSIFLDETKPPKALVWLVDNNYLAKYNKALEHMLEFSPKSLAHFFKDFPKLYSNNPCVNLQRLGQEQFGVTVGELFEARMLLVGAMANFALFPQLATRFEPDMLTTLIQSCAFDETPMAEICALSSTWCYTPKATENNITLFAPCIVASCLTALQSLMKYNSGQPLPVDMMQSRIEICEEIKKNGNTEYQKNNYLYATHIYTSAIRVLDSCLKLEEQFAPDAIETIQAKELLCVVLSNRCECSLKLKLAERALADAEHAIKLVPDHTKSINRRDRAKAMLCPDR